MPDSFDPRRFEDEKHRSDHRFDRIEDHFIRLEKLILSTQDHTHKDKVSWVALIPTLISLIGGLYVILG